MAYKLSPSDFKFLWKECKHCYYRKVKLGVAPPSGAFPGIFTVMNNLLQNDILGKNLQEINPDLPSAIVETCEGYLRSGPIEGAEGCYINGRYDITCRLNDGSLMVVDFKISNPNEDSLAGYVSQLHAYKYALENPSDPQKSVEQVAQFGLITVSPSAIRLHKGRVIFIANPVWHKFPVDMSSFYTLMKEIAAVLDGPLPEPGANCKYCQYLQATTALEQEFKP